MERFVDINAVIAEAISITPDADVADWAMARQWAITAIEQLGVADDEIKTCQIKAKDLVLPKPDDMRKYIEMQLYDADDNYIPHTFRVGRGRIAPDVSNYPYVITSTTDQAKQYSYSVDVSEDQNSFYLGTTGDSVSYARVRYYSYPLDANGYPYIRFDEKFAVMCYIQWCKASRKGENQSEIAQKWQMWAVQADRARAAKKASGMNWDRAKTIERSFLKLLPNYNMSPF